MSIDCEAAPDLLHHRAAVPVIFLRTNVFTLIATIGCQNMSRRIAFCALKMLKFVLKFLPQRQK